MVSHSIIIDKLRSIGIRGNLLNWVQDFLTGRTMNVSVNHNTSTSRPVLSGVPQGSVLGPLLFLIYINYISNAVQSQCKIFADDLKLYIKVPYNFPEIADAAVSRCQDDINTLFQVSLSWGLTMNPSKCAHLKFHRRIIIADPERLQQDYQYYLGDLPIPVLNNASDLGIIVDTSLKFHNHIQTTARKAGGLANNLLTSTVNRDPSFMIPLFQTHVRPILDYASCVWNTGYIGDLMVLESVQRRWTKHISTVAHLQYHDRLKSLKLFSIYGRLLRSDMIKCWKIFHGESTISPTDLFTMPTLLHTRGHQFKVAHVHCAYKNRVKKEVFQCKMYILMELPT